MARPGLQKRRRPIALILGISVLLLARQSVGIDKQYPSLSAWELRKSQVRTELLNLLAIDSIEARKAVPLASMGPVQTASGFTIRHLVLTYAKPEQGPRGRITAWLLLPNSGRGRLPAVVALHQTVDEGKDEPAGLGKNQELAYGAELARRGYVVLVPDLLLAGERVLGRSPWNLSSYPTSERPCLVGRHVMDTISCVSYLRSLPYVDAARIGLIGHSQGAITAFLSGALDLRVRATVANDGFMTFKNDPAIARWTMLIPKVLKNPPIDMDEFVALTAPRALLIINNRDDQIIPHAKTFLGVRERLRRIYDLYGENKRFNLVLLPGKHGFAKDQRQMAYSFLDQNLRSARNKNTPRLQRPISTR